jgi:hypothetical protein
MLQVVLITHGACWLCAVPNSAACSYSSTHNTQQVSADTQPYTAVAAAAQLRQLSKAVVCRCRCHHQEGCGIGLCEPNFPYG